MRLSGGWTALYKKGSGEGVLSSRKTTISATQSILCQLKQLSKTMPSDKSQNLQDVFLNHVRKQKTPVTVFLVNGVKLQGIITWFDNFCILLRRDGHSQLVYKHALSTVMPVTPISLYDDEYIDDENIDDMEEADV